MCPLTTQNIMKNNNHNKYQDKEIEEIKTDFKAHCNLVRRELDRSSSALIRLQGEMKKYGERIDMLSKTILGNGNPERSLISQVTRNKTEIRIMMVIIMAIVSGMIGFFINSRL